MQLKKFLIIFYKIFEILFSSGLLTRNRMYLGDPSFCINHRLFYSSAAVFSIIEKEIKRKSPTVQKQSGFCA
jgi:hypothetical protein